MFTVPTKDEMTYSAFPLSAEEFIEWAESASKLATWTKDWTKYVEPSKEEIAAIIQPSIASETDNDGNVNWVGIMKVFFETVLEISLDGNPSMAVADLLARDVMRLKLRGDDD